MSRRTRDQIDQARADVLALLEEDGPLRHVELIARVLGFRSYAELNQRWTGQVVRDWNRTCSDVAHLRRQGKITEYFERTGFHMVRLAQPDDGDEDEDKRDVLRMYARWELA